jgi:hypothetical protein
MYNLEQLAAAQHTVYVISNPDGSDAEFVPLKSDTATPESVFQELAARWAGRNLKGVGVAGVIRGIPIVMLREEPSDFLLVVRLTAAYARYVEGAADCGTVPQCGDSVTWCERLYALEDSRTN